MNKLLFISLCFVLILSCNTKKNSEDSSVSQPEISSPATKGVEPSKSEDVYVSQSTDEQTANNLKVFLKNYVNDDYSFLQDMDKQFQFYKTDLNGDGNDEIFVRLMGPYFCGSGGCTFLLLDKYGEVITKFTVTRAPIFIEPTKVNDWHLLLVKDSGVFKELRFEGGTYPSNPSILPKAPYDAPSGHAQILFDEDFSKSKSFEF